MPGMNGHVARFYVISKNIPLLSLPTCDSWYETASGPSGQSQLRLKTRVRSSNAHLDRPSSWFAFEMTWTTDSISPNPTDAWLDKLTLVRCLSSGCSIGDGDDEQRLLQAVLPGWAEQERLQDLLVERCAQRGKT
jgi:hypothetical protein